MTHAFTTQATAFCLAAAVTLGVLFGLDGLATAEHQAAQPVAQATQLAASTAA
jgi:hypothetical protein